MYSFLAQINYSTIVGIIAALFALASFILTVYTLNNVLRLRNVLITWPEGRLFGYPLFAFVFLASSIIYAIFNIVNGTGTMHLYLSAVYIFAGINWSVSSYFMSKRYITDHGIVKNINDPSQTVAWTDIHDFVEQSDIHPSYTFLYKSNSGVQTPQQTHRIELTVPEYKFKSFAKLLHHKLGRRFQYTYASELVSRKVDSDDN